MDEKLEKALQCIAALTKLHEYLDDKDVAGECMMRIGTDFAEPHGAGPIHVRHIRFYFEFPIEYKSLCTQAFFPEAMACVGGLDTITIELMPTIEAGNRLNDPGDTPQKCGLMVMIPMEDWSNATSYILHRFADDFMGLWSRQIASPIAEITTDLFSSMHDLINQLSAATDYPNEAISDDPDDSNFKLVE